jgi:putative transcriptional regulator
MKYEKRSPDRTIVLGAAAVIVLSAVVVASRIGDTTAGDSLGVTGTALPSAQRSEPDETDLAQGKLLIARRELPDPNFAETVVLLVQYNERGAMGLIVNRPTEISVSSLVPELKDSSARDVPIYAGGPVSRDTLMMLVRSDDTPGEARLVFEDVYVSRSRELLERMSGDTGRQGKVRVYVGYAGWAPGQLEAEVERGDWHIMSADSGIVFHRSPLGVWRTLLPRDPNLVARERSRPLPHPGSS